MLLAETNDYHENWATLNSIFEHVYTTACFICSKPKCNFSGDPSCNMLSTAGPIPLYNDLLEFGLLGKYFPLETNVRILFKRRNCYYHIKIIPKFIKQTVIIYIQECYHSPENRCYEKEFQIEHHCKFTNYYCISVAMAFVEKDKIHLATSFRCNRFASADFDPKSYLKIWSEECYFIKNKTNLDVTFHFIQDKNRRSDGFPIIMPCSPGGYAVDPFTGRFVLGNKCWSMFSETKNNDSGINFIIKNIYNNDEDLLFDNGILRHDKRLRPAYIKANGEVG
ncbi:UNVERIFIED_CONTAM: hypothetical protein RMT77_013872 [Armadillidium vulgare]